MVESLQCQFTMGAAMNNWNKYWGVVLADGRNADANVRYKKYMARIQEAIARGMEQEQKHRPSGREKEVKDEL